MTLEGRPHIKEVGVFDPLHTLLGANDQELLEIARSVAHLQWEKLVLHYDNPAFPHYYHKTNELRRLLLDKMRRDKMAAKQVKNGLLALFKKKIA